MPTLILATFVLLLTACKEPPPSQTVFGKVPSAQPQGSPLQLDGCFSILDGNQGIWQLLPAGEGPLVQLAGFTDETDCIVNLPPGNLVTQVVGARTLTLTVGESQVTYSITITPTETILAPTPDTGPTPVRTRIPTPDTAAAPAPAAPAPTPGTTTQQPAVPPPPPTPTATTPGSTAQQPAAPPPPPTPTPTATAPTPTPTPTVAKPETSTLSGTVFDSGPDGTLVPCPNCTVTFDELKIVTATTSANGSYSANLSPGFWDITVSCGGPGGLIESPLEPSGALSVTAGANQRDIIVVCSAVFIDDSADVCPGDVTVANYSLQFDNPAAGSLIERRIDAFFGVSFGVAAGVLNGVASSNGVASGNFFPSECALEATIDIRGLVVQLQGTCPSGISAGCSGSATISLEGETVTSGFSLMPA